MAKMWRNGEITHAKRKICFDNDYQVLNGGNLDRKNMNDFNALI